MPGKNLKKASFFLIPPIISVALAAADLAGDDVILSADERRWQGAHEEALELYERALVDDPTSAPAWSGAAVCLETLDEGRAVTVLAEAMSEPACALPAPAVTILAGGWARRGAPEKALKLLTAEAENAAGRSFLIQGQIQFARHELPSAIEKFKKAMAAGESAAPYYLAEALLEAGRCDEAELYVNEFLDVFPYVAEARCARAEIHYRRGEYDLAADELVRALTYDPKNKRALFDLAALAALKGDYGAAIRRYGEVTKLDPGAKRAFLRMAKAYEHVDALVAAQKLEEYRRRFD
ncbi:MAG: tetratricopeptide repeat protein [candidate division Zixibacteria bacterium]|nr:tetratricopeptide repeat protein [candidate division Zixibacteria bacterium]